MFRNIMRSNSDRISSFDVMLPTCVSIYGRKLTTLHQSQMFCKRDNRRTVVHMKMHIYTDIQNYR